jgi:hypothetical protein
MLHTTIYKAPDGPRTELRLETDTTALTLTQLKQLIRELQAAYDEHLDLQIDWIEKDNSQCSTSTTS